MSEIDYEIEIKDDENKFYGLSAIDEIEIKDDENKFYPLSASNEILFTTMIRKKVDLFHELLLKTYTVNLNKNSDSFRIEFIQAQVQESIVLKPKKPLKYQNPNVFKNFQTALFAAFLINAVLVLTSVCDEKKRKSFAFLKLMG